MKKFLPDMKNRYIQKNVQALDQCKQFSQHMPEFLKNRPRKFVTHCLDRIPPKVEEIDGNKMQKQNSTPLQFLASNPSGNDYTVTYECDIPVCSCPDFSSFTGLVSMF
ncbi:uncharacterized protein LOC128549740 [Mercenaria mercenaria]|uniref:uncharacterized protein LOC128549740 n=1 Tax=Mercenaria mercenaria TaxID=6596 RepID=UPI00234E6A05|nr:uncharacterized protein LOC128549740 [Mercenaria mercenaria]